MATRLRFIPACFLAITLAVGCSGPASPPASTFFSAVDPDSIAKASAPRDLAWGGTSYVGGEGIVANPTHRNKTFSGEFKCQPESVNKLLQAVKEELEKSVQAHGGQISAAKDSPGQGSRGFSFEYSEGNARGRVRASLEATNGRRQPEAFPHTLKIDVDEPPDPPKR